jgi:hypothetical protein
MTTVTIGFALFMVTTSSASAQIDTSSLRSKYGAPLERETFMVRPGIGMVVDYGPSKHVCRIHLPSGLDFIATEYPSAITKKQIDEVVDEVVPLLIRGKELRQKVIGTGEAALLTTEYEEVQIEEMENFVGRGVTITLKDPTTCLAAVSSAFAQIDPTTLRSKYGAPLERETFTVRPEMGMVADYGPNKQVCRIQLPSGLDNWEVLFRYPTTQQQIDEVHRVLDEVVPSSIRGKAVTLGDHRVRTRID